jgi:hypothetical protein
LENVIENDEAKKEITKEVKKDLDELFAYAKQYKQSQEYLNLLKFVSQFKKYSPFNATLAYTQMPGARYILTPKKWFEKYKRTIKPGARPLVILRPQGPVMFVFDVSDTEGGPVPSRMVEPFKPKAGKINNQLKNTIEKSKKYGVNVHKADLGSQRGGSIRRSNFRAKPLQYSGKSTPALYELELSRKTSAESQYAILCHELGHLFCGHLGPDKKNFWPDRSNLEKQTREFEAESVAYLVCSRQNIKTPSAEYLSGYVANHEQIPNISLDRILKSTQLIEKMA